MLMLASNVVDLPCFTKVSPETPPLGQVWQCSTEEQKSCRSSSSTKESTSIFRPLDAQQIIIELDESSSKLLISNTSITSQSDKMSEDRGSDKKRKFPNARMQHGSNGGGRKGRDLGRKEWRYVLHTTPRSSEVAAG